MATKVAIFKIYFELVLLNRKANWHEEGKWKVQGMLQSEATAHPWHEEKEETKKTKQVQIEQMYKKH